MKLELTEKKIAEIAENLDCGFRCFYRFTTGEIKTLVISDEWLGESDELLKQDEKEIEDNISEYIEFEGTSNHVAFSIMESFVDKVDNDDLQKKLINALNRPKPFRNFKILIDNSGDYRQRWFDHKHAMFIELIGNQVEDYNRSMALTT